MTKRAREEPSGDDDGAAAAASSAPLATPEIVRLNVGGRAFITTRSTLCAVPGSMLAVKFQVPNRFGPPLMDEMGAVFLDRDPDSFAVVLDYLRRGRLIGAPRDGLLERVRDDAEYFGLEPLVPPPDRRPHRTEIRPDSGMLEDL